MVLLTIAVVGGVSAVVAGVVPGGLAEPATPIPARALPSGPLTGQDVADLRFVQAFRGYRMDQVDAAMDSLAAEVDRLRALLAEESDDEPAALDGALPADPDPDDVLAGASDEVLADGSVSERATLPADWPAGRD
jgi:DivIVA domain-containing protein